MPHFLKKHEKSSIPWKLASFGRNHRVSAFWRTFQAKVAKSSSFRDKTRKIIDSAKTCNISKKPPCFGVFTNFSAKSCKSASFRNKTGKIVDLAKLPTFSKKPPFLGVLTNFSAKSGKRCLISRENTKNRRYGQNFQLFEATTVFRRFDDLFSQYSQKVANVAEKHEKWSIWPRLDTFRRNHRVLACCRTFQPKVAKSSSFREKTRKIVDLAKTSKFWKKPPCFGVLTNFSAKSGKKILISWRNTKNSRFGQILQLFEESTLFRGFDKLFRQKLRRVPHFAKKREKSSISQNLQLFRRNHRVSALWRIFYTEVAKSASFREKRGKIVDLAKTCNFFEETTVFRRFDELFSQKWQKVSYFVEKGEKSSIWAKVASLSKKSSCFGVLTNFSHRSRKKCLILRKNTKNRRFGQNFRLFEATTVFRRFDDLFSQYSQKVANFAEKHEKFSIWPKLDTFRRNHRVLASCRTFQLKVAKSSSFREKTRKIVDLAKTSKFWKEPPCFSVLPNFSAKSGKKILISWKNTKNSRFGQILQLFEESTLFRGFHKPFRQKLQRVPHFAKKHDNSSIWPKMDTFGRNHRVLTNFLAKSCKECLISRKNGKNHRFRKTCNFFEETTVFRRCDEFFTQRSQKVPHFAKKGEKSSIWQKLATFSRKPPCFGVLTNFSAKSGKKFLISWKKERNRRFGQKLQVYRRNHRVSAFWRTFQTEVARSASFCEKTRKIVDLAKTSDFSKQPQCFGVLTTFSANIRKKLQISRKNTKNCRFGQNWTLFEETTVFRRLAELFSQKWQKVPHFAKKHEKLWILPKLNTFRRNHSVSAFWRTFQPNVAKSASFREETRKIVDMAKTSNFSKQPQRFGVLTTFSANIRKKLQMSRKNTKNGRFGQDWTLFEETTVFWRVAELFSQKWQKAPHFVKKHGKSSIWPKRPSFGRNHRVSAFWRTFQPKVARGAWFREKTWKIVDLAKTCNFSCKLPRFGVLVNVWAKGCKRCVISWKTTKNHRFGQKLQLFVQATLFQRFCQLFSKSLQKVFVLLKNQVKSSIWLNHVIIQTPSVWSEIKFVKILIWVFWGMNVHLNADLLYHPYNCKAELNMRNKECSM